MNQSTRFSATFLGIYAGLMGIDYGVFEILQDNAPTEGLLINAIGPPYQPDTVWHACLPVLTIVPNLLLSGILSILVGITMIVWAVAFVQVKTGGLIRKDSTIK